MDQRSDLIMDLITRAGEARSAEAIHRQEEIMIIHAATLSARRIRTLMVPAGKVKTFHAGKTLRKNLLDLGAPYHRFYPVSSDGSFDSLTGYVCLRDLLLDKLLDGEGGDPDWHRHIRPLQEVEASSPVTPLLTGFLDRKDIAALVKKDGSNVGWVTMDDVIETLLGVRG
ncbi:hypothetical protein [Luteolibacter luteus]|uniref:CBS domain-containing protein n=1 Tax=Luteolibacter luteus TaxID=2728835 RepID=A0A858RM70_9BACT|nr:hypothetical protein [Luteolibacter luteus]QJE97912.1 hypothetical protein HHL09_19690 [Luteolibacter luteus]